MNANELADFLEKHLVTSCAILGDVTATSIITTLRQQQAEIEALKYKNDLLVNRLEVITGRKNETQDD